MLLVLPLLLLSAPGELESVERQAVQLPKEQGLALVRRWADAHPGDADVPKAWLWEAQQLSALERYDEAGELLQRAGADGLGDVTWDARLASAELLLTRGREREALAAFDNLGAPSGSRWEYQARLRAEQASARADARSAAMLGALILLGTLLTFAWSTRRALLPLPQELLWSAPVLAMFALAGATRPPGERFTVIAIALGGMVLTFIDGAWLRAWRPSGLQKLAAAAGVLMQVVVLVFVAIVFGGLLERVLDTFAGGVE